MMRKRVSEPSEDAAGGAGHQYRLLFESMLDGYALHEIICDEAGVPIDYRFLEANPAFERMTGLVAADIVGRTVLDVLPGTEPEWIERYGRVALTGEREHFEMFSGELDRWYEVTAYSPERGLFAVVFTDVTDRRNATEALRAAEAALADQYTILRGIVNAIASPIFSLDREYRYTSFNAAHAAVMKAIYGADVETGHVMFEYMSVTEDRDTAKANVDRALAGERVVEEAFSGEEGLGRMYFEVSHSPVIEAGGAVIGVAIMARDITKRRHMEDQIRALNLALEGRVQERTADYRLVVAELRQAQSTKDSFLANMSHELRTPLNAIIGFSGILLQGMSGELADEQRRQVEMVYSSGKHLLALINDVLDLSKIEAGQMAVEVVDLDLGTVVRAVMDSIRPEAAAKDLDVEWERECGLIPVHTDETKVRQILINLLSNAVKYTDRGTVAVLCDATGGEVTVRVTDTGRGISAADLSHVFEEFYQGDSAGDAKNLGTGLGLAVSRRLARMLGGEIAASSKLGRGSVFELRLPAEWPGTAED